MKLGSLLRQALDHSASDLHLRVGSPPVLRIQGNLKTLDEAALTPDALDRYVDELTDRSQFEQFNRTGSADVSYRFEDDLRCRASLFRERSHPGIVLRLIPNRVRSLDELGLDRMGSRLCEQTQGLLLFTGSAGSGKTTTACSFLQYIARNCTRHIVTIEDPIEYELEHDRSLVTQRELGRDVNGFEDGIRTALRSDPDVIFVGELRDLDTISAAVTASETGHLVLSTLHTRSASETMHRLIDSFPPGQQNQIRSQLSSVLSAIFSQRLLPRRDRNGRIAVFEILLATPGIRNLLRRGSEYKIDTFLQTGGESGMRTLDQHLLQLVRDRKIHKETALKAARDPDTLRKRF